MPEPTLTVLFAERAGALDRIVSLLRRRGFPVTGMSLERTHRANVRRMSVGVRQSSALAQISRHLARLPDVLDVTLADEGAVYREYALLRLSCTPQERSEVLAVLAAFDARPVAIAPNHMVIEAAGCVEQIDGLFAALSAYRIEDAARTSPIALQRISSVSTDDAPAEPTPDEEYAHSR
jgi:acetolactate synthase I/III small subunit